MASSEHLFDGQLVIVAGLLLLVITPLVRVAISIPAFTVQRDYTYVTLTSVVLATLILSFFLGRAMAGGHGTESVAPQPSQKSLTGGAKM